MTMVAPVSTELSNKLGSAPVVMFHLNITNRSLIPNWASATLEPRRNPRTESLPGGTMLLRGRQVDLGFALDEIDRYGYVPTRFLVVERSKDSVRMVLICVLEGCIKEGETRLPRYQEADVRLIMKRHFADVRIYRNPGQNGGNFVLECGNLYRPKEDELSSADLQVNEETDEFWLVTDEIAQ